MTIGIKFKIQRTDGTITSVKTMETDLTFSELFYLFEEFAIAAGYARETIYEHLSQGNSTPMNGDNDQ